MDWHGKLHLIDQLTGGVLWSTDRAQDRNGLYPPNSELGGGFFTSGATAFSPNGQRLAAGGSNGWLVMFNLAGDVLWSKPFGGQIRALRFTPDGAALAVGAGDWKLHLVDASTGTTRWTGNNEFWPFFFIAMDTSGTLVGSGGKDGTFSLWDARTGAVQWSRDFYTAFVTGGSISADGQRVLVSDWGFGVRVYDRQGEVLWFRRFPHAVAAMTADGMLVFVTSYDPELRRSDFWLLDDTGRVIWSYTPDLNQYCQNTLSPFPRGQFITMRLAPSYAGTVKAAAACIGGSVFEFSIPVAP